MMSLKKNLFYILSIVSICFNIAHADQLIIEPDMGREPLLKNINSAEQSLHLVMYGFTDQTLLDALLKKKKDGKQLKIILERSPYRASDENTRTIGILNKNNIDWIGSIKDIRLIHQKTLLIDNKKALVMTFNFTNSSFDAKASHPARNFALIIDDPSTVADIDAVFNADWKQSTHDIHNDRLIYSPDNSRAALLQHLDHAKTSIKMYAQQLSDYDIIGALEHAAKRGVKVEVLVGVDLTDKQLAYLEKAGVIIKKSDYYYIHAKVFMIDNNTAILGSINTTRPSLDDNRELSIVSKDPNVIQTLNDTFAHDWQLPSKSSKTISKKLFNKRQLNKVLRLMQL